MSGRESGPVAAAAALVEGLTVTAPGTVTVVDDASLELHAGRITALTGPSGCGKTTVLRALVGHLPAGVVREKGRVEVAGTDPFALDARALQRFRRERIAYVAQDPGAALNPTSTVRALLTELAADRSATAVERVLRQVALGPEHLRRRPHQLSGGEQRRVAIARALGRGVGILVIDEPLAGLDPALRDELCALLRELADGGLAIAVSGHDTAALHRLADDVVALGDALPTPEGGAVVSAGPGAPVLVGPVLVGPVLVSPVLVGRDLAATVDRRRIVEGIDVEITAGAATALIGRSGAGKTTVARVLAGLHGGGTGAVELNGVALARHARRRRPDQRRRIGWIPQDPLSTLNPSRTIGATLARPLQRHRMVPAGERPARIAELLAQVRLPAEAAGRYPHELSGGQRQRVAIARALATEPDVLICDEITSALDAGTAAAVLDVLDAARARGLGLLLITHQMELVRTRCATVTVLDGGAVVESGPVGEVLAAPRHPATVRLLRAEPEA